MNLEFNIELINFINQEKNKTKLQLKKCYKYFNNCLIKSIIELDNKFENIQNIETNVFAGINMVYYIYYLLINYSNNIKLTIFLLERAILLYSEFIIMSQDKKIIDEICFVPNTNDAVSFAYKKTIGPIKIKNLFSNKKKINNIKLMSLVLKKLYIETYLNCDKNKLSESLNNITIFLENDLFDCFDKNKYSELIFSKIKNIIDTKNTLNNKISKIKIFLETLNKFDKKNTNYLNKIDTIFNVIFNTNIDIEDYYKYKNSDLYKNCKNNILNN